MAVLVREGSMLSRRYELLEMLGKGGMGEVWKARDSHSSAPDGIRAVKLLSHMSDTHLSRFMGEALALRQCEHKHVVRFYEVKLERNEPPYLVTEYLPGGTLSQLLADAKRFAGQPGYLPSGLSRKLLLDLMRDAALGLAHIHGKGIAHRDIKPANLLLLESREQILASSAATVKVADFGIARGPATSSGHQTQEGSFIGTFLYAAPEYLTKLLDYTRQRASGENVSWTHRTTEELKQQDIFALGLVLYELWTGRHMVQLPRAPAITSVDQQRKTKEALETALAAFEQIPMPAREKDPLLELLKGMLSRAPERRPDASQVARVLEQLCDPLKPPLAESWSSSYVGREPSPEAVQKQETPSRPVKSAEAPAVAPPATYYGSQEVVAAPKLAPKPTSTPMPAPAPAPATAPATAPSPALVPMPAPAPVEPLATTHDFVPSRSELGSIPVPSPRTAPQRRLKGRYVVLLLLLVLGGGAWGVNAFTERYHQPLKAQWRELMSGGNPPGEALSSAQASLETASTARHPSPPDTQETQPGAAHSPAAEPSREQEVSTNPTTAATTAATTTTAAAPAAAAPAAAAPAAAAPAAAAPAAAAAAAAAPAAAAAEQAGPSSKPKPPEAGAKDKGTSDKSASIRSKGPEQPPPALEEGVIPDEAFERLKGQLSWPLEPKKMNLVGWGKGEGSGKYLRFGTRLSRDELRSIAAGWVVKFYDDARGPDNKLTVGCIAVRHAARYYGYLCGAPPKARQVERSAPVQAGSVLSSVARGTELTYALYRVHQWDKSEMPVREGRELLDLKAWLVK